MSAAEIRARIDRRDELATAIEQAVAARLRYDEGDWTRIADVVLPMIEAEGARALREAADWLESTDSQKGIASRALSPGKAFAIDALRDVDGAVPLVEGDPEMPDDPLVQAAYFAEGER